MDISNLKKTAGVVIESKECKEVRSMGKENSLKDISV